MKRSCFLLVRQYIVVNNLSRCEMWKQRNGSVIWETWKNITFFRRWLHANVICFTTLPFIFLTTDLPESLQLVEFLLILSLCFYPLSFINMDLCICIFLTTASFLLPRFYQHFGNILQPWCRRCYSCLFKLCRYPAIRHLSSCGILVTRTPPLLGIAIPGQIVPSNGLFNLADSFSKRKEYSERRIIG